MKLDLKKKITLRFKRRRWLLVLMWMPVSSVEWENITCHTNLFSTIWNLVLLLDWIWCQFKVSSTWKPAKNQFPFLRLDLVREPRHSITAYVCMRLWITKGCVCLQLWLLALRGFIGIQTWLLLNLKLGRPFSIFSQMQYPLTRPH